MEIQVIIDNCVGCKKCVSACPFGIIEIAEKKAVIKEGCSFCRACLKECEFDAIVIEGEEEKRTVAVDKSEYSGVWVFGEQKGGELHSVVRELIGEGRKLADELGEQLGVIVFGHEIDALSKEVLSYGADSVYKVDHPELSHYKCDVYSRLLAKLIQKHKPEIVLCGATSLGRSFIPRVAIEVDTGLTADCTGLHINEDKLLVQTRPAFGGNIMARIICPDNRPQMATVRHKVMEEAIKQDSVKGEIIEESFEGSDLESQISFLEEILEDEGGVSLTEADIIVSGGRGLGGPEHFSLIRELADTLGAAVGSSRAAVDAGWIPYRYQVGQTGQTVKPKIYIACGISGAVQHQVGMRSSDCIIAINNDTNAPIFDIAHYGVVADLFDFIPAFIERINAK
ncbi:FAD-binding protein [Planctomycetota bacterium]